MHSNNIKLFILIFGLMLFQLIINNLTVLYLDCLSVILVILLFRKNSYLKLIIFIAFFTDLMGHWYLGSHLFATILLSFLSQRLVITYSLGGSLQKMVMISVFYVMLSGIMMLIGLLTHNSFINWVDLSIEVLILCPIILWLFSFTSIHDIRSNLIF